MGQNRKRGARTSRSARRKRSKNTKRLDAIIDVVENLDTKFVVGDFPHRGSTDDIYTGHGSVLRNILDDDKSPVVLKTSVERMLNAAPEAFAYLVKGITSDKLTRNAVSLEEVAVKHLWQDMMQGDGPPKAQSMRVLPDAMQEKLERVSNKSTCPPSYTWSMVPGESLKYGTTICLHNIVPPWLAQETMEVCRRLDERRSWLKVSKSDRNVALRTPRSLADSAEPVQSSNILCVNNPLLRIALENVVVVPVHAPTLHAVENLVEKVEPAPVSDEIVDEVKPDVP